jgi:catechol 2,3-dioxygenase-like lactoylglutathione lyase family enzyme
MNLPDAPIAHDGFFVTHFFTVKDQEKSKDFYARILGGRVIKPQNPCYTKLVNSWIILNSGGGPTPDTPGGRSRNPAGSQHHEQFPEPACRRHLVLL